jgi:UDP-N-acetylmuramoyl-tripeptide--D-alanyl-D-alanine ligase
VPLTLLGLSPEHRFLVAEIATNHPGEIATLSELVGPSLAILTTVGWAHIGAFGTREAILAEKLAIAGALPPEGLLVHPHDSWLLERLPEAVRARPRLSYGLEPGADFHPSAFDLGWERTRLTTAYTGSLTLQTPGEGALRAALGAALVARELGIPGDLAGSALEKARARAMRMEPRRLAGAIVILDCYNASPESSYAAVDFLSRPGSGGRRWLAFGAMRELGASSAAAHRTLGERAAALDGLFLMGEDCRVTIDAYRDAGGRGIAELHDDVESLAGALYDAIRPGDVVLIKGSRAMAMERVYEACRRLAPREGS